MNLLYPIFSLDLTDITNSKIKKTTKYISAYDS